MHLRFGFFARGLAIHRPVAADLPRALVGCRRSGVFSWKAGGKLLWIWLAFTFEFIMMSSVAEAKLAYIAKNWINLAIILIPLIAFLRGFQVVRILRLCKAAKAVKVYRL